MFGAREIPDGLLISSTIPRGKSRLSDDSVPTTVITAADIGEGIPVFKLFTLTGLANSGGAARRLIQQGGAYVDGQRIDSVDHLVKTSDFNDMQLSLRAGKKRYHKVFLES